MPWEDVYVTGLIGGVALGARMIHASRFSSPLQHYLQPNAVVGVLSPLVPSSPRFNADPDSSIPVDALERLDEIEVELEQVGDEMHLDEAEVVDDYAEDAGEAGNDSRAVDDDNNDPHSIWNCLDLLTFRSDSITSSLWSKTYSC